MQGTVGIGSLSGKIRHIKSSNVSSTNILPYKVTGFRR